MPGHLLAKLALLIIIGSSPVMYGQGRPDPAALISA